MNYEPIPTSYRRPVAARSDSGVAAFLYSTYRWMALGLALTGVTAWFVANTPAAASLVLGNRIVLYGLLFAELGLVMSLGAMAPRLSAVAAGGMFLGYSFLNGLTLSTLFFAYTRASLAQAFFVTAASFAALSVYGSTTKRDLAPVGQFMFVGLIGLVIASLVNLFFHSPAVYWVSTYAGVLIFAGLTAYDNQRLRHMYFATGGAGNLAINGALQLYLDFVNMFLFVLRLFGDRR